jgi:hypothetical protein
LTCQVTAVFVDPETVAPKVCDAPARTLADAGETLTVTLDPSEEFEFDDDEPLTAPVQPARAATASSNAQSSEP